MGVEQSLELCDAVDSVGHSDDDNANRHQEANRNPEQECMNSDLG